MPTLYGGVKKSSRKFARRTIEEALVQIVSSAYQEERRRAGKKEDVAVVVHPDDMVDVLVGFGRRGRRFQLLVRKLRRAFDVGSPKQHVKAERAESDHTPTQKRAAERATTTRKRK